MIKSALHALLPQTQCRECGYPDCESYANALMQDEKNIGLCAPGGVETLKNIANLLKRDPTPYLEEAKNRRRNPAIVIIREDECIGCTKCIQACPVDAIIGMSKHMHTILADECTGCGLCIEPCPVDCIDILPQQTPTYEPSKALARYEAKKIRQQQEVQKMQPAKPENMQDILTRLKTSKNLNTHNET